MTLAIAQAHEAGEALFRTLATKISEHVAACRLGPALLGARRQWSRIELVGTFPISWHSDMPGWLVLDNPSEKGMK
jgi:hypothetical protein